MITEGINIKKANIQDIGQLQKIGRDTFLETFLEVNTEYDQVFRRRFFCKKTNI